MQLGKISFNPNPFMKDMEKVFVGFDEQVNKFVQLHDEVAKNIPNYPPYNIKKVADNKYVIEMAVVGFGKTDVEIEIADNKLFVRGNTRNEDSNPLEQYLFKGIATRAFTRTFAIGDHVEVNNAQLINGMLKIFLEQIIPEHKKPKKIDISDEPSTVSKYDQYNPPHPQMLVEDEKA